MSRIIAVCPNCQKKYRVDAQLIGRTTDCKQCQTNFEITADDSADSLGIPDARDFLADQAFDPLAPSRAIELDDPAQSYEIEGEERPPPAAVQARDWRKQIKQSRNASPFGPLQRILLSVGAMLALASVSISLMHVFGVELGEGNAGRFVGLVIGLVGAGLVAASLMKFPSSARIAGAATAIFVFVVFFASLVNARKQEQPNVGNAAGTAESVDDSLAQFKSPWIKEYPNWVGFDVMDRMPSPADRWNRHQLASTPFSASFLGEPKAGKERLRIARTNVDMNTLTVSQNGFDFSLKAFKFPGTRKTGKQMLNDTELAIGDIEFGKAVEVDGFSGREYRITSSSRSTHGRIFVANKNVVHIKVEGSSTMVPGVLSQEFLESLLLRSTNLTDTRPPKFELTPEQQEREKAISEHVRKVESLVSEHIRTGGLMNFPAAYLSISAGKDAGNRRFMVHPGKLPILGVDVIVVKTNSGSIITNMAPIFGEATDDNSIMAKDGYALAGLEVNAGAWIKGVRLVFMKITPVGFDTAGFDRTNWIGTRPSGVSEKLGGDGRPVYGLWSCRTTICKSIGLIRENN